MHLSVQLLGINETESGSRTFTANTLITRHNNITQLLLVLMHYHPDVVTVFNRNLFRLHTNERHFQCMYIDRNSTSKVSLCVRNSTKGTVKHLYICSRQGITTFIHYLTSNISELA